MDSQNNFLHKLGVLPRFVFLFSMGVWRWLFALPFFAPFGTPAVWALEIQSQQFEPKEYYIGQRVRLRLQIALEAAEQPIPKMEAKSDENLETASRLPQSLDYRIHSVKVQPGKKSYAVSLTYAVFNTEIERINPFVFGGLAIPALTIPRGRSSLASLSSLSGASGRLLDGRAAELPPLESRPLSLPWVDLSVALLIQLLVLLPILLFQSSRRVKAWLLRCYESYLDKKPYRRLLRQLNILQHKENLEEYYRILSSQLRHYLAQRTHHPCSAYTTEELANLRIANSHIDRLPASQKSRPKEPNFQKKRKNGRFTQPLNTGAGGEPPPGALENLWLQVLALLRCGDDLRFRPASKTVKGATGSASGAAQRSSETQTVIRFVKLIEKLYQKGGRNKLDA